MKTDEIRTALVSMLKGVSGIPEVAEEGMRYDKKTGIPFVRFKLMPAETVNDSIGVNYTLILNGLAQIDVFYPGLKGVSTAEETVQKIIDAFAPGQYIVNNEQLIIAASWTETSFEDAAWLRIPVIVRWRAFRQAV
jgi:hypothetical protein